MRAIAIAAAVVFTILMSGSSSAACGHERVSVTGSAAEVVDACRALDQVLVYFSELGFTIQPEIKITFQDRVHIDLYDFQSGELTGQEEVSGFYDLKHKEIRITSGTARRPDRTPWKIPWGPPLAYSILQHELVHLAVSEILASNRLNLSRAWREFIAYSVQLELMDAGLRDTILRKNPDIEPFQFPENVNAFIYSTDPDTFGLQSHLYTQLNGGRTFIRRVLSDDVDFSTGEILWVK